MEDAGPQMVSIFAAALERPTDEERAAFLDEACRGDAALRRRIEALLKSHTEAGGFLGRPTPVSGVDDTQADTIAAEDLGFLNPSDKPESLGRLGHYEVLEVIGKGGMGVVLRAFDEKLHRVVAIKVMAAQLATSATARRRFVREARAQAAVNHDHVVTIHAVEPEDGPLPYLVMEYVAGLSLQQRLSRDGPLELHEILRIGMQTAAGLAAAHAQGLVHRDIKPANILLENGVERVKVTDFGLARVSDEASLTQSGVVAGTPHFMSPEQARGEAVDQRSDLFSLGSVLYAMCTGRPPFRAGSSMAVLKRVCDETPTPVAEANPQIPAWLVAIIDKLHAKAPSERYQSAAEVAELLGRHLAQVQHPSLAPLSPLGRGDGATTSPLSLLGRGVGGEGRRRRWAVAAAVLLLALGGLSLTEATGVTNLRATVIRIFTPDGTLVVETDDPAVKVTVEGDGGSLRDAPQSAVAPFDAATAKEHQDAWAKHLGVPIEFTNSVGMKFRLIPPGEFEMGSTSEAMEAARAANKYSDDQAISDAITSEGPIHRVILSEPFYLGVTEVTQKEFETLTGQNPSSFRPGGASADKVRDTDASQLPVHGLSWNDAAHFCSRLSSHEGLISNYRLVGTAVEMLPGNGYRLPREAQWEFACRAGTTTGFWFGDRAADHATREWLRANSEGRPHAVGSLAQNPFGLFDMHGNVSEWCQDGWNPEFYLMSKDRPAVDPLSKPQGAHQHMVRGGAWTSEPGVTGRSAFRMPAVPSKQYKSNGLRVALTVDSARVVIERQRVALSVEAVKVKGPAGEPRAFVLIAQGVAGRKFDTLTEAVAAAADSDVIEIRGNGPFVTPGIKLGAKALTIRAGDGNRPVLRLDPQSAQAYGTLIETEAPLVLEGLEMQLVGGAGPKSPRLPEVTRTVRSHQAPLFIAHCRFVVEGEGSGISVVASPVCEVRHCEIYSAGKLWWRLGWKASFGGRLVMDNNIFAGGGEALCLWNDFPDLTDVSVRLSRNTIASRYAVSWLMSRLPRQDAKTPEDKTFRLHAAANLFDVGDGVLHVGQPGELLARTKPLTASEVETLVPKALAWSEAGNLYRSGTTFLRLTVDGQRIPPQQSITDLPRWKAFWALPSLEALHGQPRYDGKAVLEKLLGTRPLASADFRLASGSPGKGEGPGGADVGADVDRVGPGTAYERWKKTPQYQEWLRDTAPRQQFPVPAPK